MDPALFLLPGETAVLLTVLCPHEVNAYLIYNPDLYLVFVEENREEVVRTVLLLEKMKKVRYLDISTVYALRSLARNLKAYELDLRIAEDLAGMEEIASLAEEVNRIGDRVEVLAERWEKERERVLSFLESPQCKFSPDTRLVDELERVYRQLVSLEERVREVIASVVESNMEVVKKNQVIDILQFPIELRDLEKILATARRDVESLDVERDLHVFLERLEKRLSYRELREVEIAPIQAGGKTFYTVEDLYSYITANADRFAEDPTPFIEMYMEYLRLREEGKYLAAKEVLERAIESGKVIVDRGFVEEEEGEEVNLNLIALALIILLAIIVWVVRRARGGGSSPDADTGYFTTIDWE